MEWKEHFIDYQFQTTAYHMGKDKYGNDWHVRNNEDGTQDWVRSQNQTINEGGRNASQISWNEETGLYRNIKASLKRKR